VQITAWLLHGAMLNFPASVFKANVVETFKMKKKKNPKYHHTVLVLTAIVQ